MENSKLCVFYFFRFYTFWTVFLHYIVIHAFNLILLLWLNITYMHCKVLLSIFFYDAQSECEHGAPNMRSTLQASAIQFCPMQEYRSNFALCFASLSVWWPAKLLFVLFLVFYTSLWASYNAIFAGVWFCILMTPPFYPHLFWVLCS